MDGWRGVADRGRFRVLHRVCSECGLDSSTRACALGRSSECAIRIMTRVLSTNAGRPAMPHTVCGPHCASDNAFSTLA